MAEQKITRMKSTRKPLSEKAKTNEGNAEKEDWLATLQRGKETLGTTIGADGKTLDVERWHMRGISIPTTCMAGADELSENIKIALQLKFAAIAMALRSNSKDLQDEAIDTVLGDLLVGAYQDKLIAYTRVPSGDSKNSMSALKEIQRVRQAADTHLLNILKAVRDIKRPPVNVVVKQADEVNVAEQINQAEQQVNIGKHQQANINPGKQSA